MKLNLTKLDPQFTTVKGTNLAIEDKTTGKVYITDKANMDKLFWNMGYRNLNVIKILEEFAGKYISDIGRLNNTGIFVDESAGSFVVTSDNAVSWINKMYQTFENNGIQIVNYHKYDPCYFWDELTVKSPTRPDAYFDICINLVGEFIQVLSMKYDETTCTLLDIHEEGRIRFDDIANVNDLVNMILVAADLSHEFNPDLLMSIEEYIQVLNCLGFVEIKRGGKAYLTDDGEQVKDNLGKVDKIIDDYNLDTWIQKRVRTIGETYSYDYMRELISQYYDRVTPWKVRNFYINNTKESTDICLLNA